MSVWKGPRASDTLVYMYERDDTRAAARPRRTTTARTRGPRGGAAAGSDGPTDRREEKASLRSN